MRRLFARAFLIFACVRALGILRFFARSVGEGVLFGRTLAWSEPLTTLLRSAQSRVSSSRSFAAAYEDTLASLPVEICSRGVAVSNAKIM